MRNKTPEAATGGVLKKISQHSPENTCARVSFLIKLQVVTRNFIKKDTQTVTCNFIKKETLAQVFSCKFCEILRTPLLQSTSGQLLKLTKMFSLVTLECFIADFILLLI